MAALRAELAEVRAAKSVSFSLPSTGDVLSSLGLDKWKDDRLRGPKVSAAAPANIYEGLVSSVLRRTRILSCQLGSLFP